MLLHLSTWAEVAQFLQRSRTIVVPIGSNEQHGPTGLLGTDWLCPEIIAHEAEKNADILVAPTFNIGNIPDGSSNTIFFGEQFAACFAAVPGGMFTAGNLWASSGMGNYLGTQYLPTPLVRIFGTGFPPNDGQYWSPIFANANVSFGFTQTAAPVPFGSTAFTGSVYQYNTQYGDPPGTGGAAVPPGYSQITTFGPPAYPICSFWDAPPQTNIAAAACDKARLQSFHKATVLVGIGDGSVRPVQGNIGWRTWYAAINPADGIPLGSDW